jgi:hypothetical protein
VGPEHLEGFGRPPRRALVRLEANSDSGPDLAEAGIEIKSVPMRRARRELRSKERTSITMIDYRRVAVDPFEGTPLDLKTRLTLYVFFLWSRGRSPAPRTSASSA